MHLSTSLLIPALIALLPPAATATRSPKRGLVFTNPRDHPEDNAVWVQKGSTLTWYYNYHATASPAFAGIPQDRFEFVPMLWGLEAEPNSTDFYDKVKAMIEDGVNITHALSFNEPDGLVSAGGSDIPPKIAAQAWVSNFEPLRELGVRVGLPGCTGAPSGLTWLNDFLDECAELVSEGQSKKKNCSYDFLPVHWYGDFDGLSSHIGERRERLRRAPKSADVFLLRNSFPDTPIWVTEYALPHEELPPTQQFFNQSTEWFDKEEFIERYSYFGAFRSTNSTVGPNPVFLNRDGELTDIGSWYLGGNATGIIPQSGDSAAGVMRASMALALCAALWTSVLVL
ncbi:hypothetical protein jhhlp_007828 [Lomentospora prolificans]|uniref:Asl1-like glycosyl hydrolase catalytic domain-containing protein n=1 Tax=Lomentospora prolificans TaxID=41688 RepID=A0A2N3N0P9_9PEZI|nr:hypothetical protein jhhlp_007828 [Lomentospora prolificans]